MSTAAVGERRQRRAMSAGSSVGRSPCTLTTISARRARIDLAERLEDAVGAGHMIGAGHDRARRRLFRTAAAISGESVATTTGPIPAAAARRSTCTIIGSPAMSASGLPGSRVEAMRAGMRMRTSAIAAKPSVRAYTGCKTRGKPAISAPPLPLRRCGAIQR